MASDRTINSIEEASIWRSRSMNRDARRAQASEQSIFVETTNSPEARKNNAKFTKQAREAMQEIKLRHQFKKIAKQSKISFSSQSNTFDARNSNFGISFE